MKILLALGSEPVASSLAFALAGLGWSIVEDPSGEDAIQLVEAGDCDAALIDADLPSGRGIVERLRAAVPDLAILVLGRAPTLAAMERLFGAGADDVLAHPVAPQEILMRARAIARRRHGHGRDAIRFGALTVLPGSHAEVGGVHLRLSPSEFIVMERLALRAGRVVAREVLLSAIHGGPDEPGAKVVDVFMCRVRKVMVAHGLPADLIETVWGRGWRLPTPFAEASPRPVSSDTSRQIIAAQRNARADIGCAA